MRLIPFILRDVPGLLVPLLFLFLLMAPMIALVIRQRRRRRVATVLGHVEIAMGLNLPLERMLTVAAKNETGTTRQRLERLRLLVERGMPPAEALAVALPEMTERDRGWIEAGGRLGDLPDVLVRIMRRQREAFAAIRPMQMFYHWYPLIVLTMLCGVWGLLAIFVYPKFVQILRDFRVAPPRVTAWSMELVPWLWGLLLVIVLLWMGRRAWKGLERWRGDGMGLRDWPAWWFPPTRRLAENRGMEDVCRFVADALEAGWPMDKTLAEAGRLPINMILRGRVRRWAEAVGQGRRLGDAARESRLPRLAWGMLKAGERTGDVSRVLDFLAGAYTARYSRAMILLQGAYIPAVVLVMGVVVGFLSLAVMLPLRELIGAMEGGW
jgi:type II secretory pathway component PulF